LINIFFPPVFLSDFFPLPHTDTLYGSRVNLWRQKKLFQVKVNVEAEADVTFYVLLLSRLLLTKNTSSRNETEEKDYLVIKNIQIEKT
jgi:hypothetical protein